MSVLYQISSYSTYGFAHVWYNQGVENEPLFLSEFSARLADIDLQSWQENISSSSRLVNYNAIKTLFCTETYLDSLDNLYYRSLLLKLRGCLLPLYFNLGFFNDIPIGDRLCPLCQLSIEDEVHFLLICDHLKHIRVQFLPTFLYINPATCSDKYKSIWRKFDYCLYKSIAKYIHNALEFRTQQLSNL